MFLNIRILVLALFLSALSFAQQPETETSQPTSSGTKVGSLTVGAYMPMAMGDNFVNDGMDLKMGAQVQLKLNVLGDFYIGPSLSFFFAEVTNRALVGNYDEMHNIVLGGLVGYEREVARFDLSIGLGVGYSGYFNEGLGDSFEDNATVLWLRPEVSYKLANYVSVYVAPEFRHDFMNIDVPSELQDTFGGVNYFNLGLGLRINFGTGYKFQ